MSTSEHLSPSDQGFTLPSDERIHWFLKWIHNMMSQKLNQNMDQVYIHNIEVIQELSTNKGVIIAPNHVSYWDSCLYFVLSRKLSTRSFVFVAKETLERLPFLRWCGAVPINIKSKRQAIQQLLHATTLNTVPTQFWIFPQGEHRPPHDLPLQFKKGVTVLAKQLQLPIVPVSIDYLYKDGEQPVAYVSFRTPLPHSCTVDEIEREISLGLKDINGCHVGDVSPEFIPTYTRTQKSTDGIATKILAWFAGTILGKI